MAKTRYGKKSGETIFINFTGIQTMKTMIVPNKVSIIAKRLKISYKYQTIVHINSLDIIDSGHIHHFFEWIEFWII